ncbi:hypothetical protein SAMN05192583_2171 [Sphingomonas gellani]|uniref:Uncharacterized protein n=1 Tax=Sphingomonas gellani TaxID=1166340 RepID=A0A1H8EG57_9SPHN|nr:hypothetical protein [Sphingomonas gellani]SEN18561.1 hypothetical protein SAMN05192583_2171 [Sphingomonas gellani]
MVAYSRIQGLTGSLPIIGGAIAGALTVATFVLMPTDMLESVVWNSGITALVPAAEPPLGLTARAVMALGGAVLAAAVTWAALYLLFGEGGYLDRPAQRTDGAHSVRRADAHPDAPPRRPLSAADLGTPLMEVGATPEPPSTVVEFVLPVERTVPADLEERLAAFDPAAIPEQGPLPIHNASEEAVAGAARAMPAPPALGPGERLETFDLTPVIRFGETAASEPRVAPSLAELLARLEQGAERRAIRN